MRLSGNLLKGGTEPALDLVFWPSSLSSLGVEEGHDGPLDGTGKHWKGHGPLPAVWGTHTILGRPTCRLPT